MGRRSVQGVGIPRAGGCGVGGQRWRRRHQSSIAVDVGIPVVILVRIIVDKLASIVLLPPMIIPFLFLMVIVVIIGGLFCFRDLRVVGLDCACDNGMGFVQLRFLDFAQSNAKK